MADTGWIICTVGHNTGTGAAWSNPSEITLNDTVNASVAGSGPTNSQLLVARTFNMGVPGDATVTGIMFQFDNGIGTFTTSGVYATKDGSTPLNWTTLLSTVGNQDYGTSTELWGTTWSPSDVNSSTFGVMLECGDDGANSYNYQIDSIYAKVFYSPAAPITYTMPARRRGH